MVSVQRYIVILTNNPTIPLPFLSLTVGCCGKQSQLRAIMGAGFCFMPKCPKCDKRMTFIEASDIVTSCAATMENTYFCKKCAHSYATPRSRPRVIWKRLNSPLPEQMQRRLNVYVLLFILGLLGYAIIMNMAF